MRTAAYIRVSSDKQNTERQKTSIAGCAKRLGVAIDEWYEDSIGKNPRHKAEKRREFQRLLASVEAGIVKTIIVDAQDRFGVKDAFEWGEIVGKLRRNRCRLLDSTGNDLSSGDIGRVITGMIGATTSQQEQQVKADRSVKGKLNYAAKGEYQGGYSPYGTDVVCFGPDGREKWRTVYVGHLDRVKVYPDGNRERFVGKNATPAKDTTDTLRLRPSIESERVKTVKQVFKWYVEEDLSPRQIAERLNDLKISPVFSEAWYKHTIRSMLTNPAYTGKPAWNKRTNSEFVEYADGQVKLVDGPRSRRRKVADYVQPAKAEFEPLIDQQTWDATQRKLVESSNKHTRPRRAPHRAELWLRPFMVCGQCGKPMHGAGNKTKGRLMPSYFCGTYNKYGPKNPTGCHCHRIQHETIEKVVVAYLNEYEPKVAELLKASQGGDLEAIRPMLEAVNGTAERFSAVACEVLSFIDNHDEDMPDKEVAKLLRQGKEFVEIYGVLFERVRPRLESKIAAKQAALDKMLDGFNSLPESLRKRAIAKMEPLEAELQDLETWLVDWREPYVNVKADLEARRHAMKLAIETIGQEGPDRAKSDALRGVIDRIVCDFDHRKGARHNGKSKLKRVLIYPVSGEPVDVTALIPTPGRD